MAFKIDNDAATVFFASKKGLPIYKFILKFFKKRWYIASLDDQNANQWGLERL